MMSLRLGALAFLFMAPTVATAACQTDVAGAKCVQVAMQDSTTALTVGDVIPAGSSMLLNPEYYGLPPVSGYWRYYRIDGQIYEVHPETMEVLTVVSAGNGLTR